MLALDQARLRAAPNLRIAYPHAAERSEEAFTLSVLSLRFIPHKIDRIDVIGHRPGAAVKAAAESIGASLNHILHTPSAKHATRDVMDKIMMYCQLGGDDFLFMHDDILFLKDRDVFNMSNGPLPRVVTQAGLHPKVRHATWRYLRDADRPTVCYETHNPAMINPQEFIRIFSQIPDTDIGVALKSMYLNSIDQSNNAMVIGKGLDLKPPHRITGDTVNEYRDRYGAISLSGNTSTCAINRCKQIIQP